jgi:hypothetical protein
MHLKYRKLINLTEGEKNEIVEGAREISIVHGTAWQASQAWGHENASMPEAAKSFAHSQAK